MLQLPEAQDWGRGYDLGFYRVLTGHVQPSDRTWDKEEWSPREGESESERERDPLRKFLKLQGRDST